VRDNPHGKEPAHPRTELVGMRGHSVLWRTPYPRWASPRLRWDSESGLLYESTQMGLGIVDPESGERFVCVHGFGRDNRRWPVDQVALPSVAGSNLYVLGRHGGMEAL